MMGLRRIAGLGAGCVLLVSSSAFGVDRREYIVEDAFPGWEAKAAAAVVDVRCRSMRNPPGQDAASRCERAVSAWLGLDGPLVVIDAAALASGMFTEEERGAIVRQTDRLEGARKAALAERQAQLEQAMKTAIQARFRETERASSGMADMGPKTHAQLMQERAEARAKRLAAAQERLRALIQRNGSERGVVVNGNQDDG